MQKGFSLVELSIVLVILGLLTGGILAGQNLIRAAELRSVSTQLQSIQTSIYTFRDKYFALPGDMRNATNFWGIAAGSTGDDATCYAASTTNGTTCNGDGNGRIDLISEGFRAWQHLANAGLIEGSYTGVTGSGSSVDVIGGENAPKAKMGNTSFTIKYFTDYSDTNWYDVEEDWGTIIHFGNDYGVGGHSNQGDALTPEEVWNIDTKMDDGKPGQGKVYVFDWTNCTLSANALDRTADYDLQETGVVCSLMFRGAY